MTSRFSSHKSCLQKSDATGSSHFAYTPLSPPCPRRHRLRTSPFSPHRQRHFHRRHHIDSVIFAVATTSAASSSPSLLRHHQLRHRHFGIINFATKPWLHRHFIFQLRLLSSTAVLIPLSLVLRSENWSATFFGVWARRENGSATFIVFGHGGKTGVRHLWYFS